MADQAQVRLFPAPFEQEKVDFSRGEGQRPFPEGESEGEGGIHPGHCAKGHCGILKEQQDPSADVSVLPVNLTFTRALFQEHSCPRGRRTPWALVRKHLATE